MERKRAIEILRKEYDPRGCDETLRRALETLIPELAESEDERIRKFLVDYFTSYKIGNVTTKLNGYRRDDIIAYLEKQKDLDKMIVVSPEVWDNAISDAFENGKKEGEKQKENPKSAISIPTDCTANAKCEDRWHKVADSLPDNPREVLCKDEAGNFFIGRYYVGEGWEISNYDDEDKLHDLNPPVSKWIDFPSEKQKEQKPNFDTHWENGSMVYEQKEQKPAEWSEEDEKMLQSIIKDFRAGKVSTIGQEQWLQSLRPSWKPTEEQMIAFRNYIDSNRAKAEASVGGWNNYDAMIRLFEDLKKL